LKLKSLLLVTLLVVGCSAAFGQSLGFEAYDGVTQFCDYEVLSVSAPFAAGVHNLTTVCGFPYDGSMVGFKGSIPASTGQPLTGGMYALADNTFDAEYAYFTGLQINWVTKLVPSTKGQIKNGKFGWAFYYNAGGPGSSYLGNFGFLTSTLGGAARHGGEKPKTSFGAAAAKAKVSRIKR
jgi:hypothetical protein